jgi:hypothetical protein
MRIFACEKFFKKIFAKHLSNTTLFVSTIIFAIFGYSKISARDKFFVYERDRGEERRKI